MILDIRNSMKQYTIMHELEIALVTHGNGRTLIKPVYSRYPLFCLSSSCPILPHFLTSVGTEMDEGPEGGLGSFPVTPGKARASACTSLVS